MLSGSRALSRILLAFGLSAVACAQIAGVDHDYYEVSDTGDAASGSAGASAAGGAGGTAGIGGTSAGGSGTGGASGAAGVGGGGGSGGPDCSSVPGSECIQAPPAGFLGPVLLREATTAPPACPPEYPTGSLLYGDFVPGQASCNCSCTPPTTPCTVTLSKSTSSNCLTAGSTIPMPANACVDINVETNEFAKANGTPNGCTASPGVNLPTPSFQTEARYCGGANLNGTCSAGQICAPTPPANALLCVRQDGDVACPTSGYTDKYLRYDGFTDTRACTTCSCGSPSGTCGSVQIYAVNCSSSSPSALAFGTCKDYAIKVFQGKYQTTGGSVSCAAQGGSLQGSAVATNPITFCCMP